MNLCDAMKSMFKSSDAIKSMFKTSDPIESRGELNFQNYIIFDLSTLEAHRLSFTWPNEAQDGSLERENQGEYF